MALFTVRQTRPRAAVKSKDRHTFMYLYILGVALLLVISVSLLQFGLTRPPKDFHVHPDPRHARKGVSEDLRGGLHHHRQKPGENPRRTRRPPVMKVEKKKTGAAEEETTTQEGRDIVDDGESSRMYQGQQLDDMDQFYREQAKVENLDRANKRHTFGDDLLAKFVEDRQFGEKSDDPVKKGSVRAAIEQEMAKRRTGRDNSLRRSLGETGVAPPREFLDDGKRKSSLHTDEEPNVKGEEDAGDDVQTAVKDVVVHSSHVEEENSEPALEINNLTALTTTSTALVEDHLESVDDVVQTDKQVIIEEDEDEKRLVAEKNLKELEVEKVEEQGELKEGRGKNAKDEKEEGEGDEDHDNMIQWGFYPTLSSTLKFSKFLSSFFKQEKCTLRIFMAWTTAPWAYTPRHQRAIESILHFHPEACIVVFTETVDFKFFDSWVKEGYKIAVARPNLEELLGKTPAIDFAYVWYEWRSMNLFYIHYTELLRIAALHKYGGVWLDMDMILARPLPKLHNVLGSTVAEDGEWVLNGAFMSFDRSSSFLKACIEEFVATYDERLLGWNGADLLNRVASNATRKGGKVWLEHSEHLQVLEPIAFFPLSRHNIIKYFSAPKRVHERVKQKKMLSAILGESHGTHLWNSVTGRLVPEVGSVVEKLLNHFCMRCTDIL